MNFFRPQRYCDPCRRGSFSSGSCYGGSGQRISYYPSYGRSCYPQSCYGGYGRSYYPKSCYGGYGSSYLPPVYYGGYGYGRCYYPQGYGGYGYGGRYGYGSRRGSICYEPCSYPRTRRYSCSSIDGCGKIPMDF